MAKPPQQQQQQPHQPPPPPRLPSADDLTTLTHLSTLLHLLHHRNKNQHRRSPWYKHLSLFRRHLTALLTDYKTLLHPPTTALERTRLKAQTPALHLRISQRLEFWTSVLVGRWAGAFSQVVADGRFAVLGLVGLGVLGSVCRVVGVGEGLEVLGQEEVERVLGEFGREVWGDAGDVGGGGEGGFGERVARGEVDREGGAGERVARVDEGEVVAREEDVDVGEDEQRGDEGLPVARDEEGVSRERQDESDDEPAAPKPTRRLSSSPPKVAKTKRSSTKKRSTTTDTTESKPKPAKKKRKKGGDAIDDLFSGW